MGSKSNYLENKLNDHVHNTTYTAPATIYIALYTSDPTDADSGAEVSTGVWTNYARIGLTRNTTSFPASSGGAVANGILIDFGAAAISGTAPVVTHWGSRDASSAGNLLYHGTLTTSKTINNGDPVSFAIGALTVTED